jgi:glycine betaine catabolism B
MPTALVAGVVDVIPGSRLELPPAAPYEMPLLESRQESPSVMTFRFSTEGTGFRYRSNQAVRVKLLGVDDPWGAVRTFSLSSSPSETGILGVTCKITDTPFKQALSRLEPGATAQIYGPIGSFLLDTTRPCLFLAGGIGITPFRGMLRYAADTVVRTPLTLLYTARVPEELVFRTELDALARDRPNFRFHYTVTRAAESATPWAGRVGRMDQRWIEEAGHLEERPLVYVAGLPGMVEEMIQTLTGRLGVAYDDIDYELFRGF